METKLGLAPNFFNRVIVESSFSGAFARLERGELSLGQEFYEEFQKDCETIGKESLQINDIKDLMRAIEDKLIPVPEMFQAAKQLRQAGFKVGIVTNNWKGMGDAWPVKSVKRYFDCIIESSQVGFAKP